MITPLEIETKDFAKSMRGYNQIEVDDFLDKIIEDLEVLLEERDSLKKRVELLEKEVNDLHSEIGEHKKTEASVINTLDSAKVLVQDISVSAEKRADIILQNAKLDAELIMKDAKEAIQRMGEECSELRAKSKAFRQRYRDMLEEELTRMNETEIDLYSDFDENFNFETDMVFEDAKQQSDDEVLSLEDLIEDLSPANDSDSKDSSRDNFDMHTKLMSELTDVFDSGAKSHNIPTPKETVVLNATDIDELLNKKNAKDAGVEKNTVIL